MGLLEQLGPLGLFGLMGLLGQLGLLRLFGLMGLLGPIGLLFSLDFFFLWTSFRLLLWTFLDFFFG